MQKIIVSLQRAPQTFNIPGRSGAVYLMDRGARSEPIEPHPEHGLGPEVDAARLARRVRVEDAPPPPAPSVELPPTEEAHDAPPPEAPAPAPRGARETSQRPAKK